ncbi:glycosyltransferase [Geomonas anaerohicana]|uniref:Glycosyltransferase n=1 Tax=Geomonas anaerohicana TaxID=2798583 RepID=A0ABS0YIG9_9BACT|nr:glycosyltransferase [Geomonas anaerohicana]MBJ6751682.1 glycosyltransferase [Geomonas anaerohicana]
MSSAANRYLVSAIVSTYNADRFLRGKLEDLEAQTIAPELEIIVIDSASPGNERAIVEEFQARYDNIRYLRTEKRETVYQAWNRGIRMATGEFVTNANTDDRLRRDAYEVLVRTLREHPECVLAYPDMRITKQENATFERHESFGFRDWPEFDRLNLLELCCVGPFPLWRRSLHDAIGYFDERFRSAADYELWLRAALRHDFIHVPQFLGLYWLSEETVSRKGDLPTLEYLEVQKEYRPRFAPLAPPPVELEPEQWQEFQALAARLDAGDGSILPELERFSGRHPRAPRFHLELARIFYKKGEIGYAKKNFEKAAIIAPGDDSYRDALLSFLKSELYQALQHQTAFIAVNPDDLEAHLCAGMILVLMERYQAALSHYRRALEINPDSALARENIAFLERELRPKVHPLTSIVVAAGDDAACVRECLESVERHTPEPHEVILVFRGSDEAALAQLQEFCDGRSGHLLIDCGGRSPASAFGAGLREAVGRELVLLQGDVVVTRGWLARMLDALAREPKAALCGPMTNRASGPQGKVACDYRNLSELDSCAERFADAHYGRRIVLPRLAGFCLLFSREVLEEVGEPDGSFASDAWAEDFSLRAALKGYGCVAAGDVFVHRYGTPDEDFLLRRERPLLERKWEPGTQEPELALHLLRLRAAVDGTRRARAGRLTHAVNIMLEQGVGLASGAPAPYLALAGMLAEAGQSRQALEVLAHVPPGEAQATHLLRARCHEAVGERDLALAELERAAALDDQAPELLELQGVLALQAGERDRAEELLRRALVADPGYARAYCALAAIAWERGEKEQGLQLAERAFLLDPLQLAALGRYHDYATALDLLPREEERLREAVALYPEHKGLCYGLIELLIRSARYGEAIREIERAAARFGLDDAGIDAGLQIRELAGAPPPATKGAGSISVCMIVKDEAGNLAAALDSVHGLADELIVVDTGSTDRTRDIARIFGARLSEFPWTGSFAAARNFSLAQAAGDWILVLDADEVLAPTDLGPLADLVRNGERIAYSFTTRNYTRELALRGWVANGGEYPEQERGRGWTGSDKVRLFPNLPTLRFEGTVHELLEPSLLREEIPIHACDVPVHHYGKLDQAAVRAKQELYYRLGLQKLEETGTSHEALAELARQATELGFFAEAEQLWQRLLGVKPDHAEAYFNLGYLYLSLGDYPQARSHAARGAELAPDLKEAAFNLAKCELYLGDTAAALARCRDMLHQWPGYPAARSLLAVCLLLEGDRAGAEAEVAHLAAQGFDCADFLNEYAGGLQRGGLDQLAAPLADLAARLKAGERP